MADNHSKERMQAEAAFAKTQDRPGGKASVQPTCQRCRSEYRSPEGCAP